MPWLMDSVETELNRALVCRHILDTVIRDVVGTRAEQYSQLEASEMIQSAKRDEPQLPEEPVAETTTTAGDEEDDQQVLLTLTSMTHAQEIVQISTNVLWIRNCSTYSEPMTSHACGWLVGSQQTRLHMRGRTSWPPS